MNKKIFINVRPDPYGQILNTRFDKFDSRYGISGLGKENGDTLELLAVHAAKPGTGQFRRFIIGCKLEYKTICVWHVGNQFLASVLVGYGFKPETMIGEDSIPIHGYRFDR